MTAELLAQKPEASVWHASWEELLTVVERCDTIVVDAPYSKRTHAAHDDGALTANKASAWAGRVEDQPVIRPNQVRERKYAAKSATAARKALNYSFWTPADVEAFVDAWAPRARGWFCSITDTELAPAWATALAKHKRLVFSPLACVEPGSRVRMMGDGPAQWSCWLVVARPRSKLFSKWGALPGAYVVPRGFNPRLTNGGKSVIGGKSLWTVEQIVSDYSRPGDLVVDPCVGGGTTAIACCRTGRRFIGGDVSREHAEMAANAVNAMVQRPLFGGAA